MALGSLKGFIPGLARTLNMTPAALYERQRVLVAAGMLNVEGGRGPGSGVRLTVPAVITLLLSVLGTDSLSESAARMTTLLYAKPTQRSKGPLAKKKTLLAAIRWMIVIPGEAERLQQLAVSQNSDRAWITLAERRGKYSITEFVGANATNPAIERLARMDGAVFRQIAADMQAVLQESMSEEQEGS